MESLNVYKIWSPFSLELYCSWIGCVHIIVRSLRYGTRKAQYNFVCLTSKIYCRNIPLVWRPCVKHKYFIDLCNSFFFESSVVSTNCLFGTRKTSRFLFVGQQDVWNKKNKLFRDSVFFPVRIVRVRRLYRSLARRVSYSPTDIRRRLTRWPLISYVVIRRLSIVLKPCLRSQI